MTDRHEKRGFLDDSRLDNVTLRAFETSSVIGNTIESQKERETETAAESNIANGKPHEATNTKGEWKAQGLKQCKRCGVAKDEQREYRAFLLRGAAYTCSYCKECETEMARTRRFTRVVPLEVYPRRVG